MILMIRCLKPVTTDYLEAHIESWVSKYYFDFIYVIGHKQKFSFGDYPLVFQPMNFLPHVFWYFFYFFCKENSDDDILVVDVNTFCNKKYDLNTVPYLTDNSVPKKISNYTDLCLHYCVKMGYTIYNFDIMSPVLVNPKIYVDKMEKPIWDFYYDDLLSCGLNTEIRRLRQNSYDMPAITKSVFLNQISDQFNKVIKTSFVVDYINQPHPESETEFVNALKNINLPVVNLPNDVSIKVLKGWLNV